MAEAGQGLLFDMDGVIVDSNPLHREAWKQYTFRCGIDAREAVGERLYGRRNDEIVRDIFGPGLTGEQVAAHGAAKEALYREMARPKLVESLMPGVRDFPERHAGLPAGVAANAEPANLDFGLDGCGLRRIFQVVVDGHPEIYPRAAELLGIAPHNCIVFEDSYSGIEAARSAGTRIVGLRTTHAALPGAHLEIDDFRAVQLGPWLREQFPRAS